MSKRYCETCRKPLGSTKERCYTHGGEPRTDHEAAREGTRLRWRFVIGDR